MLSSTAAHNRLLNNEIYIQVPLKKYTIHTIVAHILTSILVSGIINKRCSALTFIKQLLVATAVILTSFSGEADELSVALAGLLERQSLANHAEIAQLGSYNLTSVAQAGEQNYAYLVQSGLENTLTIEQQGFNNSVTAEQSGRSNSATILQVGQSNVIQLQQLGDGNSITIQQTGAAAEMSITQFK